MKTWLIIGKIFLSLLALMVGALLGDIIGHGVLKISPDPKSLTITFIWVLIFPVWYPSKILFRLVATIVGPIVAFLFWSISLAIPIEAGSGMVLLAGGIKAGAFLFTMLVQFIIMRQARVLPVARTIYSDEKDDLEPEWVNSRDDLEAELENNKETQKIDAEPVKRVRSWIKKWGLLSVLWVFFIPLIGWHNYGHLLTDEIVEVRIDVEIVGPRTTINNSKLVTIDDSVFDLSVFDRATIEEIEEREARREGKTLTRQWFSVKKLKPNSAELAQARESFPGMNDMADSEFSDHLWNLVQKELKKEQGRRSERFKERMLNEVVPMLLFPPIAVLALSLIIAWGLRKYPPSELTPYTKKIIVASVVWIMGTISWFKVEEGLDDGEYVLVYILPPLLLIVASVLWKWANKPPADISRQSDVDY